MASSGSQKTISLSVEETNALRAKLGLKPLRQDTGAAQPVQSSSKTDEEDEAVAAEAAAIQERIEAARRRRLLNQRLSGRGLGEASDDEDDSASAATWVAKSRARADQRREQLEALQRKRLEAEATDEYGEADIAGLQVAHNVADLVNDAKGKPVILTLRDSGVLDDEDNDAATTDVLEHTGEVARLRREELKDRRTGAKRGLAYEDEDEFADPATIGPHAKRRKASMLSKYDQVIEEQEVRKAATTERLGDAVKGGKVAVSLPPPPPAGDAASAGFSRVSLDAPSSALSLQSEYLSPSDMVAFKRSKGKRRKKRDASSAHRKAPGEDVADDLDLAAVQAARRAAAAMDLDESSERFLARIGHDGDDIHSSSTAAASDVVHTVQVVAAQEARDRAVQQQQQQQRDNVVRFNDSAEFARFVPDERDIAQAHGDEDEDDDDDDEDIERSRAEQGTASDLDVTMTPAAPEQLHRELEEVLVPVTVRSGGVAAALSKLREQGMLREQMAGRTMDQRHQLQEERSFQAAEALAREHDDASMHAPRVHVVKPAAGEVRSRRGDADLEPVINPIVYEHRDEHGRLLTQKEVFRRQSWAFHGKKPGKKKMEKILAREEEQRQRMRQAQADVTHDRMRQLEATTRVNQQAFVVLEGRKLLERDTTPMPDEEIQKRTGGAAARAMVPRQARGKR